MKTFLILSCIFIINLTAMAQFSGDFKLPKTWEKDFVVTVSRNSSMSGGHSKITVTHDSCTYFSGSDRDKDETKSYLMKHNDRVELLAKLHEFKADKISSKSTFVPVNDGWDHSICFNSHCIEGGTSTEMGEKDKNRFLDASRLIENFAIKNVK